MVDITPGRYRHFKGNEYEVLGVARHSETLEDHGGLPRPVRRRPGCGCAPPPMWSETVEKDGYRGPRFVPVEDEK